MWLAQEYAEEWDGLKGLVTSLRDETKTLPAATMQLAWVKLPQTKNNTSFAKLVYDIINSDAYFGSDLPKPETLGAAQRAARQNTVPFKECGMNVDAVGNKERQRKCRSSRCGVEATVKQRRGE